VKPKEWREGRGEIRKNSELKKPKRILTGERSDLASPLGRKHAGGKQEGKANLAREQRSATSAGVLKGGNDRRGSKNEIPSWELAGGEGEATIKRKLNAKKPATKGKRA